MRIRPHHVERETRLGIRQLHAQTHEYAVEVSGVAAVDRAQQRVISAGVDLAQPIVRKRLGVAPDPARIARLITVVRVVGDRAVFFVLRRIDPGVERHLLSLMAADGVAGRFLRVQFLG